jgi:2,5-diketo-D-gluconate reductase A
MAVVSAGPLDIPTIPMCTTGPNKGTCYNMPIVGQGSCCGAYNISSWLSQGGLHIDTSVDYGSQPTIAAAVQASGIPRSKLWITSKLNVESCATNMTQALFELVLQPLQMTYVDLLILHHAGRWETDNNPHPPCFDLSKANAEGTYYNCRLQTVQAYEAIVAAGYARTWGVSNWQVRDLEQMYAAYGYYPALNQIEYHPWWRESDVVSFCNKHGIVVEAYAPVGDGDRSHMRDSPIFAQLAATHGITVGQVIMSYNLQSGADIVIPRSATPSHQLENLNLFGPGGVPVVTLSEVEIATIQSNHTYSKIYHTDCQPWC